MPVDNNSVLELISLAREMREASIKHGIARATGPLAEFEEIAKNDKAAKKRFEAKVEQVLKEIGQ